MNPGSRLHPTFGSDLRLAAFASLWLAALSLSPAADAAPRLAPPTASLCSGHNQVVAGTVLERQSDRVRFQASASLCGEPAGELVVRIAPDALSQVVEGEAYILGFTRIRRNPLLRDVRELDPDGPRALEIPYLGTALLEDSSALRRLLSQAASLSPKSTLNVLTELLESGDAKHRRLAIAELQLRPELYDHVGRKTGRAIRELLAEPGLDADLQDLLLQVGQRLPERYRGPWLAEASRRILGEHGPEVDLTSSVPALLQTALTTLGVYGEPRDAALAARHLRSNNPGVVKAALRTAGRFDAALTLDQSREALRPADLHPESRRVLEDYLKQHRASSPE